MNYDSNEIGNIIYLDQEYKNIFNIDYNSFSYEDILYTIIYIIKNRNADFFINKTSPFFSILEKYIKSGKIKQETDINNILFKKDKLIFFEEEKDHKKINKTYNIFPPNIITYETILILYKNLSFFQNIKNIIDRYHKKIILYTENREQYIAASILYIISDNISEICYADMHSAYDFSKDFCLISIYQIKHIDSNQRSILIYNSTSIVWHHRFHNISIDYLLLFSIWQNKSTPPPKAPASLLAHKPFILWAYPHAGTNRFMPVFGAVSRELGLNFPDYSPYKHFDMHCIYTYHNILHKEYILNNKILEKRIFDIYKVLHPSQYIVLHYPFYRINKIQNKLKTKVIILIRDLRDIIVSNIIWFYMAKIQFKNKIFEDIAIDFMKNGSNLYLTERKGNYLKTITKEFIEAKNNKYIHFVKFENLNTAPFSEYINVYSHLHLNKHPNWTPKIASILKYQIESSKPAEGRGVHGAWKQYFTPKMKQCFKENSNHFLKIFGYEEDDHW